MGEIAEVRGGTSTEAVNVPTSHVCLTPPSSLVQVACVVRGGLGKLPRAVPLAVCEAGALVS